MHKIVTAPTTYEDDYAARGIWPVAGVDEAGRGALAGPVVACAIILPQGIVIDGVYDSKKLSVKRRNELAMRIKDVALAYNYGIVGVDTIEEINILQATLLAMKTSLEGLYPQPMFAMIDGTHLPSGLPCRAGSMKKGDQNSHLVAAASILAKVKRDGLMQELHEQCPQYGFDRHKGYGTKAHFAAIGAYGLCAQHRTSFCKGCQPGK